jgi:hypothetical protein
MCILTAPACTLLCLHAFRWQAAWRVSFCGKFPAAEDVAVWPLLLPLLLLLLPMAVTEQEGA